MFFWWYTKVDGRKSSKIQTIFHYFSNIYLPDAKVHVTMYRCKMYGMSFS